MKLSLKLCMHFICVEESEKRELKGYILHIYYRLCSRQLLLLLLLLLLQLMASCSMNKRPEHPRGALEGSIQQSQKERYVREFGLIRTS